MFRYLALACFVSTLLLNSCSMHFWAYVRNIAHDSARLDVFVLNPKFRTSVPSTVKMSTTVVKFKNGFRKAFNDSVPVIWLDSLHFQVVIPPQATIDLEDVAGYFLNARPWSDVQILVTLQNDIDTLMNGIADFNHEKFHHKQNGLLIPKPLIYYDIK